MSWWLSSAPRAVVAPRLPAASEASAVVIATAQVRLAARVVRPGWIPSPAPPVPLPRQRQSLARQPLVSPPLRPATGLPMLLPR